MAIQPNTARATKRWKALIGTDEYQGHTSSIEYNPNYTGTVWKGGDNNTISDVVPGDPSLVLTMAQDTENEDSLWRFLHDAPVGTPVTFIWYPHYDGTFALTTQFKTVKPPLKTDRAGGVPEISLTVACTEATTFVGP
jgi:hypothetical protein